MEVERGASPARRPGQSFPFSAIVGQDSLKLALLLNAVDPRVGGVLIRGERGTAKSTAVRALAGILPPIDVVEGCRYSCDPSSPQSWCSACTEAGTLHAAEQRRVRIVELPVSATEDRLVGTLDLQAVLSEGRTAFQPGLLAQANRGIIYVDEVNLLDDHLVDTLLDAAAMGVNTVEREGVSVIHPARFILVGTMNPEEGDLRPQLTDRFGLCVDVCAVTQPSSRVEIVRRRESFEDGDPGFWERWHADDEVLSQSIAAARDALPQVAVSDEMLYVIADLAVRSGVEGHRADTVMARAAAAHAALDDRSSVELVDIERVAPMVLAHRLRSGRELPDVTQEALALSLASAVGGSVADTGVEPGAEPGLGQAALFSGEARSESLQSGVVRQSPTLETPSDRVRRSVEGKRHTSRVDRGPGRAVRSEVAPVTTPSDMSIGATVRAAASRTGEAGDTLRIETPDLRRKVRTRKVGASIVFCVDASGSMGATDRLSAARGVILEMLVDAYQRRDRVGLVTFRGQTATTVLPLTASTELARVKLGDIATGGSTPVAAGIHEALALLDNERHRRPDSVRWLILLTDGRANVGLNGGMGSEDALKAASMAISAGVHVLVVDTTPGTSSGAQARALADAAGGQYIHLRAGDAVALGEAVGDAL